MPEVRGSFIGRHLDPASYMGEVLFGLIMTLTFTLAKPWLEGLTFLLVGLLLVALAIPLGG